MDLNFIKNGGEDQMELMLMQMDVNDIPLIDFAAQTDYQNLHHATSPPLLNHLHAPPSISFSEQAPYLGGEAAAQKRNSMAAMREMIFRIAAMQPIHIDPESVKPLKRRNVKISRDPQSVAARHRRERISERIRILQRLVPGGTKMDTASMLDEAIHYVKFLKNQVQSLEQVAVNRPPAAGVGFPVPMSSGSYFPVHHHHQTTPANVHE